MKHFPEKLKAFNSVFIQLLLAPVFTLLYAPINRYVILPKLGSGASYTDMEGNLVTVYFSANTLAKIFFYLLFLTTVVISVKKSLHMTMWKRILYLILCILVAFAGGLLFLEFSLWSN